MYVCMYVSVLFGFSLAVFFHFFLAIDMPLKSYFELQF